MILGNYIKNHLQGVFLGSRGQGGEAAIFAPGKAGDQDSLYSPSEPQGVCESVTQVRQEEVGEEHL